MARTLQPGSPGRVSPRTGFSPLNQLRAEMEDLFGQFSGDGGQDWAAPMLAPPLDFSESDNAMQVRLDLPGVDPKQIDIQISGNQLTISGERSEEVKDQGEMFHRIERRAGRFSRSITLPCTVDEDKIDATYHDGVLTISVPKSEASKARRIEVKTG